MSNKHLPDHHNPAIYTNVPTTFRWIDAGLLWPDKPCNFIAHFQDRGFQIPEHHGLLSVKRAYGGHETYEMGRERISVRDSSYLILNEGQSYGSSIPHGTPVESFAVFFDPSFASDVLRALVTDEDHLLDAPVVSIQPVTFLQQLYWSDDVVSERLDGLRDVVGRGESTPGWLEEQFHDVLAGLLVAHRAVRAEVDQLTAVRPALRVELYRRLHRARDFMDSNLERSLSLPEIAAEACFSPHHFLRTFRQAFHETPHQYLTRRRIEWAKRLLAGSSQSVTHICGAVGFESLGSFSWLFRQRVGVSPDAYRRAHPH